MYQCVLGCIRWGVVVTRGGGVVVVVASKRIVHIQTRSYGCALRKGRRRLGG